ncbi:hypothetical protein MHU86_2411 [Fragilaria crotonensis]|nr:hypothetical protein MHU86_2411 [Fragilaria crotonensis]
MQNPDDIKDVRLMGCTRRVILDAFWSRARQTVVSNSNRFREMINLSLSLGFDPPYDPPGPLPSFDHCGYKVAILMVAKSLQPGRHNEGYTQWDTIRKFKSTHSNQSRGGRTANVNTMNLSDSKGSGYDRFSTEVCGSLWFQRFTLGCRKRMGQDWRPNRAISNPIMVKLLRLVESKIRTSVDVNDRLSLVMAGACFCYVVSLRSPEGLMVDMPGLIQYGERSPLHVIIPLLGQVKGEDHTRQHLLHCVNETHSGIHVRNWLRRLKSANVLLGRTTGPAFVNPDTRKQSSTAEMNDVFIELLTELLEDDRDLFAVDIQTPTDLHDKYNVFRSFRRGSESRAVEKNVSEGDRYIVNRWRKKERAGASKITLTIDQSYVDVSLAKDPFLRYTGCM